MYSPKIDDEHIPALYQRAKALKIPMTRLVNQIIRNALKEVTHDGVAAFTAGEEA